MTNLIFKIKHILLDAVKEGKSVAVIVNTPSPCRMTILLLKELTNQHVFSRTELGDPFSKLQEVLLLEFNDAYVRFTDSQGKPGGLDYNHLVLNKTKDEVHLLTDYSK